MSQKIRNLNVKRKIQIISLPTKRIIQEISCRELERIIKEGRTQEKIAEILGVNYKTLSNHISKKLKSCFYTTTEYAQLKGVKVAYVRKLIKEGKIPAVFYGKNWLIPKRKVF